LKEIGEGDQPLEENCLKKDGYGRATLLAMSVLKVTAFSRPPPL
jgi:hypothetical protein